MEALDGAIKVLEDVPAHLSDVRAVGQAMTEQLEVVRYENTEATHRDRGAAGVGGSAATRAKAASLLEMAEVILFQPTIVGGSAAKAPSDSGT